MIDKDSELHVLRELLKKDILSRDEYVQVYRVTTRVWGYNKAIKALSILMEGKKLNENNNTGLV